MPDQDRPQLDRETKLIISYLLGGRDAECAKFLVDDLRFRIDGRMQHTTTAMASI